MASMTTRRLLPYLLLLGLLAALAGCAPKNTVVGTWDASGGPVPVTQTFKADGTFESSASMGPASLSVTGTYKVNGEQIEMTPGDANVTGITLPKDAQDQLNKQMKQSQTGTLKWTDKDNFTMSSGQTTLTFKRKAEGK